jgi:hypothetical protein
MASSPSRPTTESAAVAAPVAPEPGAARRAGRGQVLSYGTGRRCSEPSCTTVLSRYNEHPVCALHRVGAD